MANIEADNDRELIIRDLVESYDLLITSSSHPGGICAVSTLINIYEKYGFYTLDRVLRLCVATWEGAPMSFSSNMLNAIAHLDNAYGETMTRQMLRGIRVNTKEELEERIYRYFDEVNREPVIYHWKYKMDEISEEKTASV